MAEEQRGRGGNAPDIGFEKETTSDGTSDLAQAGESRSVEKWTVPMALRQMKTDGR